MGRNSPLFRPSILQTGLAPNCCIWCPKSQVKISAWVKKRFRRYRGVKWGSWAAGVRSFRGCSSPNLRFDVTHYMFSYAIFCVLSISDLKNYLQPLFKALGGENRGWTAGGALFRGCSSPNHRKVVTHYMFFYVIFRVLSVSELKNYLQPLFKALGGELEGWTTGGALFPRLFLAKSSFWCHPIHDFWCNFLRTFHFWPQKLLKTTFQGARGWK